MIIEAIWDLTERAHSDGIFSAKNVRFLRSNLFSRAPLPKLRVNIKVHKNPLETRPIVSLKDSLIEPIAIFINQALLPLQQELGNVVTSTLQVTDFLNNLPKSDRYILVTFDITALYPSLPLEDDGTGKTVMEVLTVKLRNHYVRSYSWCSLVVELLSYLLHFQVLSVHGIAYKLKRGILTGMHCASTLANCYLDPFDQHVLSAFPGVHYKRYIDDGLMAFPLSQVVPTKEVLLNVLNSWHRFIHIADKNTCMGSSVHFLDLAIKSDAICVSYSTYFKPQSIHDFVPYTSAHRKHVGRGIVRGQMRRLLITNSSHESFEASKAFLLHKLSRRGYLFHELHRWAEDFPFERKYLAAQPANRSETFVTRVPFLYVRGFSMSRLESHLNYASDLLSLVFGVPSAIKVATRNAMNLFRIFYRHTWHTRGRKG